MAIPGYANKRLYGFRRARMQQAGEHVTTGNPYYPTRQQDIISAERFVNDLTGPEAAARAQRTAQMRREQDANLMAGQAFAATRNVVRCTLAPYPFIITSNAGVAPFLLVPQNINRVFLQFFVNPGSGAVAPLYYSFGAPLFYNAIGPKAMITINPNENKDFDSSAIPSDEIWVASSPNNNTASFIVYEGVPIA